MDLGEKRNHHRREANLFAVFQRLLNKESLSPQVGFTRDISMGGAYFYTRGEVEKGENISLTIHLTSDWAEGGSPPRLRADAEILRVERGRSISPTTGARGVAVKFMQELAVSF